MADLLTCAQCEERERRIQTALQEIEVVLWLMGDWDTYPYRRLRETYVALRGWKHEPAAHVQDVGVPCG